MQVRLLVMASEEIKQIPKITIKVDKIVKYNHSSPGEARQELENCTLMEFFQTQVRRAALWQWQCFSEARPWKLAETGLIWSTREESNPQWQDQQIEQASVGTILKMLWSSLYARCRVVADQYKSETQWVKDTDWRAVQWSKPGKQRRKEKNRMQGARIHSHTLLSLREIEPNSDHHAL